MGTRGQRGWREKGQGERRRDVISAGIECMDGAMNSGEEGIDSQEEKGRRRVYSGFSFFFFFFFSFFPGCGRRRAAGWWKTTG